MTLIHLISENLISKKYFLLTTLKSDLASIETNLFFQKKSGIFFWDFNRNRQSSFNKGGFEKGGFSARNSGDPGWLSPVCLPWCKVVQIPLHPTSFVCCGVSFWVLSGILILIRLSGIALFSRVGCGALGPDLTGISRFTPVTDSQCTING